VVGEFHRHADVLSFGPLEVTDAPCSPSLATQEAAILAVLDASGLGLELSPDRLTLTSSDSGDQLELVSSRPLQGTTWLLQSIRRSNRAQETVTLLLRSGEVQGEGPCGSYDGHYATDGRFISFASLVGQGTSDCDRRPAQRALFDALRRAVLIDREDGELRLADAAGKELARFRPAAAP
jgi:heat shock protein HslJ